MLKKRKVITNEYAYTVIYEPIKEGGYQVFVPLLSGIITYGRTLDEARSMARDAIKCRLESLQKELRYIPHENEFVQERVSIPLKTLHYA